MIDYRRHVLILCIAAVVLQSSMASGIDSLPSGDARFVALFGLPGTLHSTALVLSSKQHPGVKRGAMFIFLSTLWSIVGPCMALFAPLAEPFRSLLEGSNNTGIFVVLATMSALGAAGYWRLIHRFWRRQAPLADLAATSAACISASLNSVYAAAPMSASSTIRDSLSAIAWWIAFSASLYWSEWSEGRD